MTLFAHRKSCIVIVSAIALLAGCGKEEGKTSAQVAARVNNEEISVHQINYLLGRSGNIPAEQMPAASKQVLDKLIDQDVLTQKAVAEKLDRDPNVMVGIETSRRQILAQAYMERVMSAATKPTSEEISDYYTKHPELFSHRRLFRFQEVSIAGGKDLVAELQQQLAAGKTLADIVAWAQSKNLRVNSNVVVKAAEQIPMEMLPRLSLMKDGQVGLLAEPGGASLLQLLASQDQPVDEKGATATIGQYLTNQRKSELAAAELKQLKAAAKIEYIGDFAKNDAAPAATPMVAQPSVQAAAPVKPDDTVSKAITGMK